MSYEKLFAYCPLRFVNFLFGGPPIKIGVGLSASSPRSFLAVGFPLLSLAVVLLTLPISSSSFAQVDKKYLLGQFDESNDARFIKLDDTHTKGSATGKYLRKETYEAFIKMATAAKQDGINLFIISATRNFDAQKGIWEDKWDGRKLVQGKNLTTVSNLQERAKLILLYSSMPGTSRHHWGTDMDLNSLENSYFASGEGLKIYQWLTAHATEFDFCQPYTSKASGRTGYEEEKWHWSYLPLSSELQKSYVKSINYSDIKGFKGSEIAKLIKAIEKYVQGVSCK
jgi:zinc D-Ala-D-Ala carboxypeptidase